MDGRNKRRHDVQVLSGTRLAPVKRTDRVIGDCYTTNRGLKVTWKSSGFTQACLFVKCTVRPYCGLPDDVRPSYCATHKLLGACARASDMEDIVSKRCLDADCKVQPSFGLPDDARPSYCVTHKLTGMEDIGNKRCAREGCKIGPSYGLPDDARPSYCAAHKLSGMEDIVNKRCAFDG